MMRWPDMQGLFREECLSLWHLSLWEYSFCCKMDGNTAYQVQRGTIWEEGVQALEVGLRGARSGGRASGAGVGCQFGLWWCVLVRRQRLTRWRGWVCAVGRARAT